MRYHCHDQPHADCSLRSVPAPPVSAVGFWWEQYYNLGKLPVDRTIPEIYENNSSAIREYHVLADNRLLSDALAQIS